MSIQFPLNARQESLLIFIARGNAAEIDPVRIMKGLFLFSKETPVDWVDMEARYSFRAYHYGPCSFEIYSDLEWLESLGHIKSSEVLGRSWKYYSMTAQGRELVGRLVQKFDARAVSYLEKIREFVEAQSFRSLLDVVYSRYPDFAVNSVFKY